MCGIAGVLKFGGAGTETLQADALAMGEALRHRGPDGAGSWVDAAPGIALVHRRLAVLELSELGAQPMESRCGRYVITFNGEIYNFRSLRTELANSGHHFRGGSDTEVLLAAVSEWGLERALGRVVGMFAFAVWDRVERKLRLATDRAGEKPLYYGYLGRTFAFGSELSALEALPGGAGDIDRNALALYLKFGHVPAPCSIYSQVRKLMPGHVLTVDAAGETAGPAPYWNCGSLERAPEIREGEAIDELERLLDDAVKLQTMADVPVGAFLSGGVDSSAVVALMRRHVRRVRTFTIGFAEPRFDEAGHARAVAQYLGTDHTELRVTARDAMAVIPKLPQLYAEPFADASQIPTFLVSQLARREVTVALSGDGADELFGGYSRYLWTRSFWRAMRGLPRSARRTLAWALERIPAPAVEFPLNAHRLKRIADLISSGGPASLYLKLLSSWSDPLAVVEGATEVQIGFDEPAPNDIAGLTRWMMRFDFAAYLPNDILVKLDRASMGVGLEARAPFLDHRIIEFANRLPLDVKFRNGQGKWLLRQVLDRHVPRRLVDRPKAGFAVPLDRWIRGPLREWAEELLSERSLRAHGYFRVAPIRLKWREHLAGSRNWISPLWTVLAFQAWHERRPRAKDTEPAMLTAGTI
jgi:asparagine synthase (glutamine-hydrolysing)